MKMIVFLLLNFFENFQNIRDCQNSTFFFHEDIFHGANYELCSRLIT